MSIGFSIGGKAVVGSEPCLCGQPAPDDERTWALGASEVDALLLTMNDRWCITRVTFTVCTCLSRSSRPDSVG